MYNTCALVIEAIGILVGIIITILQIRLTKQINNQAYSNKKGYFALKNISAEDIDNYNLGDHIEFSLFGEGDVILLNEQVIVNGNIVKNTGPCEQLFSKERGTYGIDLKLNENKLKLNRLNIELIFDLKNLAGYKYTETMQLEFKRTENENYWELTRENILFKG